MKGNEHSRRNYEPTPLQAGELVVVRNEVTGNFELDIDMDYFTLATNNGQIEVVNSKGVQNTMSPEDVQHVNMTW